MNLIFIYGPPAVGKLTIAEKLSKLTNIPLFHNHLSRDIVKEIYRDELKNNYALVRKIRSDVLSYCASTNTNLIFTFVYAGEDDDEIVKENIKDVESNGGKVLFVELTADREDLVRRVGDDSRKRFKKLTDPKILSEMTKSMEMFTIPFVDSLKINTSNLEPEASAILIADKLSLHS